LKAQTTREKRKESSFEIFKEKKRQSRQAGLCQREDYIFFSAFLRLKCVKTAI